MMNTVEERMYLLKESIKKEFEQWRKLSVINIRISAETLIFEHRKGNYRIKIVFDNLNSNFIEINILEKDKRKPWSFNFLNTSSKKFTSDVQDKDILFFLQNLKKKINIKELFII